MSTDRETRRIVRSWLEEGVTQLPDPILDAVLDQLPATPQRRATWWPVRRSPQVNSIVKATLAAAAVVAIALVGFQLVPRGGAFGTGPTQTPHPTAVPSTPQPTPAGLLPARHWHELWVEPPYGVTIHVLTPAAGWYGEPGSGVLTKDDSASAPDGARVTVIARTNHLFVGSGDVYVYEDPCHWESTKPRKPVTTVDEAIAALSAQATRDASAATAVTYDGFAGKYITLSIPDDAVFSGCDQGEFRTLEEGEDVRIEEEPGQKDLITVLDVSGELVIFDVAFFDGTPPTVLDEMAEIVESARLEYTP